MIHLLSLRFMSLEVPNIDTSQIYTLHFQNHKFYEIKYDKYLERAEILCGKLGPRNTKITSRLNALYKEIQEEEQAKNFMRECIKKKLTKGYQFLDPPRVLKLPEITSQSILGKRSGQTINEIEPDLTKKFNNGPLQSSQEPSSPGQSSESPSTPKQIITDKKFLEITPEKKENREKKVQKLELIEKYTHKMKKPKRHRTMGILDFSKNPNKPDFSVRFDTETSESASEIPEEDNDNFEENQPLSDPEEEIQTEKTFFEKEEFLGKENSLRPIFNAHELLTLPSEWKDEYPIGWYMNKIREGVRCMWNGFEMRTEKGCLIELPEFFIKALPKNLLDGELCVENGVFTMEEYQVIQCLGPEDEDYERIWNDMKFMVYDAPRISGNFEERLEKLKKYFEDSEIAGRLYVHLEDYNRCRGKIHAESELEKILRENGKGIRLTNPLGKYEKGVTKNVLFKMKSRR